MVEEQGVAQILLGVRHLIVADPVQFGYGQAECMKMARHIDESAVLIAVGADDTNDGATCCICLTGVYSIGALLLNHTRN